MPSKFLFRILLGSEWYTWLNFKRILENISAVLRVLQSSSEYNATHPVVDIDEVLSHHSNGRFTHFLPKLCGVFDLKYSP